MKPLAPNTLLQNRYLIVHLIGKGGMGDVYLAVDQRLGSAVALKRTLHGDDLQLGEQFEREARTLARLRHPVLPKVSDHFTENDNQYIVMEHISGDDLASRLKSTQKPFPLSWVLYWADQLLDALAYLHTHEPPIIHRDIKPQNLKLTDDNNIVLLDFGLSKNTPMQAGNGPSGSSGSVVGYTPHYAPMEQIRGTGTNPRSDIYALSATVYQLLTNVVPPDALSRADFLLSGKTDPIPPINEVNNEIPKAISDVVLKGMSISQDQRFPDAREMQKVLRETYAKLQSDVSDKTIAFNAQDELPVAPEIRLSDSAVTPIVTLSDSAVTPIVDIPESDVISAYENVASSEAMGAQTVPFGMIDQSVIDLPAASSKMNEPTSAVPPSPNLDATLRMDAVQAADVMAQASEAPRQSDLKTEVFNDDFGMAQFLPTDVPEPGFEHEPATPPSPLDSQPVNGPVSATAGPQSYVPEQTVPLIRFDAASASFDPAATQGASVFDPVPAEKSVPDATPNPNPRPRTAAPIVNSPETKKSKGFLIGILAGIFVLGTLLVAGVGGAWYLMNQPTVPAFDNVATPSPTATPLPSPTPEPTPDSANTENSSFNGNANSKNGSSSANTEPTVEPVKTPLTQNPGPQATRPPATPRQQNPTVPRPTSKPVVKPEPTQKTRGTIIPQ